MYLKSIVHIVIITHTTTLSTPISPHSIGCLQQWVKGTAGTEWSSQVQGTASLAWGGPRGCHSSSQRATALSPSPLLPPTPALLGGLCSLLLDSIYLSIYPFLYVFIELG